MTVVMTTILFQKLSIQVPSEDLVLLRAGIHWMTDIATAEQVCLFEEDPLESRRVLVLIERTADVRLSDFKKERHKGVNNPARPGVIRAKQNVMRAMSHLKGLMRARGQEDRDSVEDRFSEMNEKLDRMEEKLDMILRSLDD